MKNKLKAHAVLLVPHEMAGKMSAYVRSGNPNASIDVVHTREELDALGPSMNEDSLLISFGTGVIVPGGILAQIEEQAVNFHAASPDFPGRDPHHFAVYRKAERYGATAHWMTGRVDAGQIIGVRWFDISHDAHPYELLQSANEAALALASDLIPRLMSGESVRPVGTEWGGQKTKREDFQKLCRLTPSASEEELGRRLHAVEAPGYNNLHLDVHGHRFRYEEMVPSESSSRQAAAYKIFTEKGYADVLDIAKAKYRFAGFSEVGASDRHVLWRHDVDFSVHRALRLAQIEHEKGIQSTFFFMLNSLFYNLAEPEVLDRARKILALGHHLGLHLNPSLRVDEELDLKAIEQMVKRDSDRLTGLLGQAPVAVSFHNPDVGNLLSFDQLQLGGLVNTYSSDLREDYAYCSDSNGYWRFTPLPDLLTSGEHKKIHVLTHPGWWTPQAMSPRDRIDRCTIGRSSAVMATYDKMLEKQGRSNLR